MRFIKENFSEIIRLYVNHIGITIFAMFTITAFGAINSESDALGILASALSMLFYYVLIYFVVWEIGGKDRIRIDAGRMEKKPAKGLLLGLCGNIPHIIISLVAFIVTLINAVNVSRAPSLIANPELNPLGGITLVFWTIMTVHGSMYQTVIYNGIVNNLVSSAPYKLVMTAAIHMIIPVIAALVTQLAYSLGVRDRKITDIFRKK